MNTRRSFLKNGLMAAAGTTLPGRRALAGEKGDLDWGALLHLGSNMWRDWTPEGIYPKSTEEEAALVKAGKIVYGGTADAPGKIVWQQQGIALMIR